MAFVLLKMSPLVCDVSGCVVDMWVQEKATIHVALALALHLEGETQRLETPKKDGVKTRSLNLFGRYAAQG